jgi:hypothetical protein
MRKYSEILAERIHHKFVELPNVAEKETMGCLTTG